MMDHFTIDDRLLALAKQAEIDCKEPFARMDEIAAYNEEKVLSAFMECRVSDSHFKSTTVMVTAIPDGISWMKCTQKCFALKTHWCVTILYPARMRLRWHCLVFYAPATGWYR